jgi:hypothetical protein
MQFQVTAIEFDFDGEDIHTAEYNDLIDDTVGHIWEADDEDDLVEEITCATGWCIKSIDYRHVLQ